MVKIPSKPKYTLKEFQAIEDHPNPETLTIFDIYKIFNLEYKEISGEKPTREELTKILQINLNSFASSISDVTSKQCTTEIIQPSHLDAILGIECRSYVPELAYEKDDVSELLKDDSSIGVMIYIRKTPVGYFLGNYDSEEVSDKDTIYLNNIVIAPKSGIEHQLPVFISLFDRAAQIWGYEHILTHELDDKNKIKVFEEMGYQKVNKIKGYYELESKKHNSDAWLLKKDL